MVEQIMPNLILMDINMPRMGGFEGCQELKKCHPNNDISIVFLTGQNNMESIIHGFEPGDRDYLTKPFNIEDAIQCVKMAQEMIFRTKIMGLDIPIGISTGECTVGNFGSFDRTDYTITGKEVNVAFRLEGLAARGRFLFSESTYQLVKDEVACQSHGTIQVKGFESSLMTYWVKSGGSTVVPNS